MVIVLLSLLGTLWSGYLAYKLQVSSRLRLLGGLTVLALLVQAVFGAVLAAGGQRPQDPALHFILGPLSLFALPVAMLAARGRGARAAGAIVFLGWLVTLGLSLRATGTGGLG